MTVEQLIIDDSFINYCFQKKAEDVEYWISYIESNPEKLAIITEASSFVLSLSDILQYTKDPNDGKNPLQYLLPEKIKEKQKPVYSFRRKAGLVAASVIFLITAGLLAFYFLPHKKSSGKELAAKGPQNNTSINGKEYSSDAMSMYQTGAGEQKTVWLPDNTKIIMNASSTLTVAKEYGINNRKVLLEGEALFDVAHNEKAPFLVEVKDFTVKVLGTKFNVRSYISDKQSEASLLRGKIEVMMKSAPDEKLVLKPLQKVIVSNKKLVSASLVTARENRKIPEWAPGASLPNNIEESLIETSWLFNRLEIIDESFEDFAANLERRFGVTIQFRDNIVKKYKYTAVFERENIDQVLGALAGSLPFNYERKENIIIIKK